MWDEIMKTWNIPQAISHTAGRFRRSHFLVEEAMRSTRTGDLKSLPIYQFPQAPCFFNW